MELLPVRKWWFCFWLEIFFKVQKFFPAWQIGIMFYWREKMVNHQRISQRCKMNQPKGWVRPDWNMFPFLSYFYFAPPPKMQAFMTEQMENSLAELHVTGSMEIQLPSFSFRAFKHVPIWSFTGFLSIVASRRILSFSYKLLPGVISCRDSTTMWRIALYCSLQYVANSAVFVRHYSDSSNLNI